MSSLKYYSYAGVGEANRKSYHYSSSVRKGDEILISGQGGWDPTKNEVVVEKDLSTEIDKTFENIDLTLRTAGGKGWSQVYSVRSYHVVLNEVALEAMVRNLRKWCPDHEPLFTMLGVSQLAIPDMKVEIEVAAWDPEGAEAARGE